MTSFDAVRQLESGRSSAPGGLRPRRAFERRAAPIVLRGRDGRKSVAGDYGAKRGVDFALALIAVAALAPVLGLIWLCVITTSPGPGLHWSPRVGRFGRKFWMPKFRTMRIDAPRGPRESLEEAQSLITPLGAFLRRVSLDELPQLFSILGGDMSFVGPRPLLADDPGAIARELFPHALEARPGLSGLAQVRGRNRLAARRKARLDAFYAKKASLRLDAMIMFRTMVIVFTGRGFM